MIFAGKYGTRLLNLTQVPSGSSLVGTGTSFPFGFDRNELSRVMFAVKNWSVAVTGNFDDWWNTGSLAPALPGGKLPNNNLWDQGFFFASSTGFVWPDQTINNATPWYNVQQKYCTSFSYLAAFGIFTEFTLSGFGIASILGISLAISWSAVMFDGTLYYPSIGIGGKGTNSGSTWTSVNPTPGGGSTGSSGTFSLDGKTADLFSLNAPGAATLVITAEDLW